MRPPPESGKVICGRKHQSPVLEPVVDCTALPVITGRPREGEPASLLNGRSVASSLLASETESRGGAVPPITGGLP
jgi:hypothetical protein